MDERLIRRPIITSPAPRNSVSQDISGLNDSFKTERKASLINPFLAPAAAHMNFTVPV